MARKGERGAEEEWVGFEGPCGKGRNKSRGLKGVVFVDLVSGSGSRDVGGDEAERGILGTHVKEVVVLELALFDDTSARCALRYGPAGCRGGAPTLRRRAIRTLHRRLLFTLSYYREKERGCGFT